MKYRAICPHCGLRFPRRMSVWNVPHLRRRCSRCGETFRAVAWSEYVGDAVMAAAWAAPILLALFGNLSWLIAIALAIAVLGISVWAWPYFTIFEKASPKEHRDA